MTGQTQVLVLTRPARQSAEFLQACEARLGRALNAVISPVIQIEAVPYEVNLDRYRTLIVTSSNALDQINVSIAGRQIATVGARTATRAADLGAHADCLGETVEGFLENADRLEQPAVHLRGTHSRGALAERLTGQGKRVDECIVYDQRSIPLSEAAKTALAHGSAVVPVFSPRSAALISRHLVHPDTQVLMISAAAKDAWTASGQCTVAERPDRAAMLDLVVRSF